MKLCLVGIFYPLAMLRYFERALKRREDIELISVGPFTNNWIPWKGGMTLPMKYARPPTFPLPQTAINVGNINPAIIENYATFKDIDLWVEVDAGFYLDPKPSHGIVAHVATDPHVLNYDRQRQLADFFFNMQKIYSQPNDIYLPYAYDPTVHFPEKLEKIYDASLIGLQYEHRNQLINALDKKGYNLFYDTGQVYEEYRTIVNQSKIGLNWSSMQDLNARAFEIPAMKICPVMNRVPDISNFFTEGVDYLAFSTLEEAIEKVEMAISNPHLMNEIAENAYTTVEPHTYDNRVKQILETVGLI